MHKFPDWNTKACKINVHVHVHVVCDVHTCTCKINACMYMCNVHNSDDMGNANLMLSVFTVCSFKSRIKKSVATKKRCISIHSLKLMCVCTVHVCTCACIYMYTCVSCV